MFKNKHATRVKAVTSSSIMTIMTIETPRTRTAPQTGIRMKSKNQKQDKE